MSVEIMPLGRHDLMARIDGSHGTRPVVGIAYREADGEHFRVWDVAATRDGPVAENVTRERAKALLATIAKQAEQRRAGFGPTSTARPRPSAWREDARP